MESKIKAKEIQEYGVQITIFENGDVYISTEGDVHVLKAKWCIISKVSGQTFDLEEAKQFLKTKES